IPPSQTINIIKAIDNVGSNTGDLSSGDTTDDTSPVLIGSLSHALNTNELVRVFDGNEFIGDAVVAPDGINWEFSDTRSLVIGAKPTYTAFVVDNAGNIGSSSNTFELMITLDAPIIEMNDASDGELTYAENNNGLETSVELPSGLLAGDTINILITNPDGSVSEYSYLITSGDIDLGAKNILLPSLSIEGTYSVSSKFITESGVESSLSNIITFSAGPFPSSEENVTNVLVLHGGEGTISYDDNFKIIDQTFVTSEVTQRPSLNSTIQLEDGTSVTIIDITTAVSILTYDDGSEVRTPTTTCYIQLSNGMTILSVFDSQDGIYYPSDKEVVSISPVSSLNSAYSSWWWDYYNGFKEPVSIGIKLSTENDDEIVGTSHGDFINGLVGDDVINGLDGDDVILGGLGNDILTGGEGDDLFIFEQQFNDNDIDTITDFVIGTDKIDLTDILQDDSSPLTVDDFLAGMSAVENNGNIELHIVEGGNEQTIILENISQSDLGLSGASSSEIVSELFFRNVFNTDY
ncbi:type I secretion C-terminal target domain-containing protein, partial [Vibrio alginolyticus]